MVSSIPLRWLSLFLHPGIAVANLNIEFQKKKAPAVVLGCGISAAARLLRDKLVGKKC